MSIDVKGLLKQAKRRQVTEDVCLRGDLAGEYERLEKQLEKLPASNKLGGDPQRQTIQDEMERLRAEMAEATVPFVLAALSDAAFQQLVDDHPPRRDDGVEVNPGDAGVGFNRVTFYPAAIRACVIEPTLDAEDWALLLDNPDTAISAGQMMALKLAVMEVNGKAVDVPFSPADSNASQG